MIAKNTLAFGLGVTLVAAFSFGLSKTSAAPAAAAAKATCAVSEVYLMNTTTGQAWTTVMSSTMKMANKSDIFCDVSLESGLITQTLVQSKGSEKKTSTAEAEIRVRCLIDGHVAYPGEVVFASRSQELSATFQGIIAECFTANEDGTVVLNEECVEAEELELILSTMNANSFNFIYGDCDSGMHTIEVQAMVTTSAYAEEGSASAYGTIGKGSFTVEQVRAVQTEFEL